MHSSAQPLVISKVHSHFAVSPPKLTKLYPKILLTYLLTLAKASVCTVKCNVNVCIADAVSIGSDRATAMPAGALFFSPLLAILPILASYRYWFSLPGRRWRDLLATANPSLCAQQSRRWRSACIKNIIAPCQVASG